MRRRTTLLVGTLVAALALAAGTALAADRSVTIVDFAFSPSSVTITAGDTVTWTNQDAVVHTATGDGWDTGDLDQGESGSIRFDTPGTYAYICTPHPTMTGTVVVEAAAGGGGGGGGGSTVTPPPGDTVAPASQVAPESLAWLLTMVFVGAVAVVLRALPRRTRR